MVIPISPPFVSFRILIDVNVPAADDLFGRHGEVMRMPGREIRKEHLAGVDALVVRSVTPVTEALLRGTSVRFVGSSTAGVDHVDLDALERLGIAFASAPGSNADAVADYVVASLLAVAADRDAALRGKTLGVVGCGEVGRRVVHRGAALGMQVIGCDPFLSEPAGCPLVPLEEVVARADILTLHVPLTNLDTSIHPTRGMIGEEAFEAMKRGSWMINTARGGVVEEEALVEALHAGRISEGVLDVWRDEPHPNPELIDLATIATPHIAGYALDAKLRGTMMIEAAMSNWLQGEGAREDAKNTNTERTAPKDALPTSILGPGPEVPVTGYKLQVTGFSTGQVEVFDSMARAVYDIREDDRRFRDAARRSIPDWFSALRNHYPERREMQSARVIGEVPEDIRKAVDVGLGCKTLDE